MRYLLFLFLVSPGNGECILNVQHISTQTSHTPHVSRGYCGGQLGSNRKFRRRGQLECRRRRDKLKT